MRAGLALVAREGDPLTGAVTKKARYLGHGAKGSVSLSNPGRFDRITAVVVNADDRVKGFIRNDWSYSRDGASFQARLAG